MILSNNSINPKNNILLNDHRNGNNLPDCEDAMEIKINFKMQNSTISILVFLKKFTT